MTDAEADLLLRSCGLELQRDSVELLVERTEGWPAALYLATLSLQDADDADRAARDFAGDDRIVADYLRDEFVARLTSEQLDFLTRTSILDELSGELCDSVLGAERLGRDAARPRARGNALVNALDAKERTFRYHALLREMLGSELRRLAPARRGRAARARQPLVRTSTATSTERCRHAIATGDARPRRRPDLVPGRRLRERRARGDAAALAEVVHGGRRSRPRAPLCLVRATCGADGRRRRRGRALGRPRARRGSSRRPRPDGDVAAGRGAGDSGRR